VFGERSCRGSAAAACHCDHEVVDRADRIKPPFQPLVAAQTLARRAVGADGDEPLFLAPDNARPATPRHIHNWLARISRETGLRFDATSGWNRYSTPSWATFHQLAAAALIAC
jgi:hypothetical protein